MKHILTPILILLTIAIQACTSAPDPAAALERAAAIADSIAHTDADGSVISAPPGLQASFAIPDAGFPLTLIGRDIFDVLASQQLKKLPAEQITYICDALRDTESDLTVTLTDDADESVSFTLTPRQILQLRRAKSTDLNIPAARTQLIAIASAMVPAPDAASGSLRTDAAIVKSFLQYEIIWPKPSDFDRLPQGALTARYFNPLKQWYQSMGRLAEPVIEMLTSLGIDGIRILYTAEGSDRQLRQAFPWREIRQPIQEK